MKNQSSSSHPSQWIILNEPHLRQILTHVRRNVQATDDEAWVEEATREIARSGFHNVHHGLCILLTDFPDQHGLVHALVLPISLDLVVASTIQDECAAHALPSHWDAQKCAAARDEVFTLVAESVQDALQHAAKVACQAYRRQIKA